MESMPLVTSRQERQILETPDSWIIPDSVITVAGVRNKTLREWAQFEKTGNLFDGVPIVFPHPDGPVVGPNDLNMVGGVVRNVRLDPASQRILADYHLMKHEVNGFKPHPNALLFNQAAVKRFIQGDGLENSPGYIAKMLKQKGVWNGQPYDEVATDIVPNHVALLGLAGDHDPGACPWPVCGLGAAQESVCAQNERLKSETPPNGQPETILMPDCQIPECKTKHEAMNARALAAEGALNTLGDVLGMKEAKPSALIEAVKIRHEKSTQFDVLEQKRADAENVKHESLLGDVVKIQARMRNATTPSDVQAIRENFAAWPLAALETHKQSLEAAIRITSRDATRVTGMKENLDSTHTLNPEQTPQAAVGKQNGFGGYTVDWAAMPKRGGGK